MSPGERLGIVTRQLLALREQIDATLAMVAPYAPAEGDDDPPPPPSAPPAAMPAPEASRRIYGRMLSARAQYGAAAVAAAPDRETPVPPDPTPAPSLASED